MLIYCQLWPRFQLGMGVGLICEREHVVHSGPFGLDYLWEGGGYSIKFSMGRLLPEVQMVLAFNILVFTKMVPLSYT